MNNILDLAKNDFNKTVVACADSGTRIFMVGGFLRDFMLQKESYDIDYAVIGESAIGLAKKCAKAFDATFVLLDEERDIARVVLKDKLHYFDFAKCQNDNIEEDIKRRDLTINALVLEISPKVQIIDLTGAVEDIKNKKIKAISEFNITDDPLRILRLFRFASQLGFSIDETSLLFAKKHAKMLSKISKERIHQELIKFFDGKNIAENISLMRETGVLYEIFEELQEVEKIPPNSHHHLTLIEHLIETVRQIEGFKLPEWLNEKISGEMGHGIKIRSLLMLGALLHDIGKPQTWTIEEETGRHRFIKHDEIGAEIALSMLKRLKFGKHQAKYISKLIRYHIYPSQLLREEGVSKKALSKMFRKMETETPEIIIIAMADRLSARGPKITENIVENNINGLKIMLDEYKETLVAKEKFEILLNGTEIMEILGITPSPLVGQLLKELADAQIAGEVLTKEDAKNFILLKKN